MEIKLLRLVKASLVPRHSHVCIYSTDHSQLDKRVRVTRVYEAPARESISGNRVYPVPAFRVHALARAHASIRDSTAKNLASS